LLFYEQKKENTQVRPNSWWDVRASAPRFVTVAATRRTTDSKNAKSGASSPRKKFTDAAAQKTEAFLRFVGCATLFNGTSKKRKTFEDEDQQMRAQMEN